MNTSIRQASLLIAAFASLALATLPVAAATKHIPLDDFTTIAAWSASPDGGQIDVSQGDLAAGEGRSTMRLRYPDAPVHWGNAVRAVTLPLNGSALEFDVKVLSSDSRTLGFIWMAEKDGDAWRANWSYDANHPDLIPTVWSHVRVPFTSFTLSPRGNKIKEMPTVVKLLIGFSGGRADVLISHVGFEVQDDSDAKPLATTPGLAVDHGTTKSVAILSDDYEHRASDSDPAVMAAVLKAAGYGVTLLRAGDLADPAVFNRTNFDTLILPYGGRYPFAANATIRPFLRKGGTFLSTGGYVFDEPTGYTPPMIGTLGAPLPIQLGSRFVTGHDVLIVNPDSVPAFDPGNILEFATSTRVADGQAVIPTTFKLPVGVIEGYGASAMLGNSNALQPIDSSRRVPLLMTYDKFGRERGAIGAMVYNYGGPWQGSAFAIFGATNVDLFAKGSPLLGQLPGLVKTLLTRVFLRSVRTDLRMYEPGEPVKGSAFVENPTMNPFVGTVTFTVTDRNGKLVGSPVVCPVKLTPHIRQAVDAALPAAKGGCDLYTVTAKLTAAGVDDQVAAGYCVTDASAKANEFKLGFKDNYFQDGARPLLMTGTNMTSSVLYSDLENPLQWDTDLARLQESGLTMMRVIGMTPWLDPVTHAVTVPPTPMTELPKPFLCNIDAFIQLAQRRHIALIFNLCDAQPRVAISQADLGMEAAMAKLLTEHLRGVASVVYDLSNEPIAKAEYARATPESKPKYDAAWEKFLRSRYSSDEALATAWATPGATIAAAALKPGVSGWADRRGVDYEDFFAQVVSKWADQLTAAIRSADSARMDFIGFLGDYGITNKARSQGNLSFASLHSYAAVGDMRNDAQMFDHRAVGQGITLTEYGDLANFSRRMRGEDRGPADVGRFLRTTHAFYGLGGALTTSWLWKDMDDATFPYGLNNAGAGPRKTSCLALRNTVLLLRAVKPVYKPATVYVVAASEELAGATGTNAVNAYAAIFEDLRSRQIDFGVIDHHQLDRLPATAKVLICPVAFEMPDEAYAALTKFVNAGGTACIAGDFSFDTKRQRAHADRLTALGGFSLTSSTSADPWAEPRDVTLGTAQRQGSLLVNAIGRGNVVSTLDPTGGSGPDCVYAAAVDALNLPRLTPPSVVSVTRIPEADGARSYFAYNPTITTQTVSLSAEKTPITITVGPNGVGYVRVDATGSVTAIESEGPTRFGAISVPMSGHFALVAPKDAPLATSTSVVVLPFGSGTIDISAFSFAHGATVRTVDYRDGKTLDCGVTTETKVVVDDLTGFDLRIVAPTSLQPSIAEWARAEIELTR